MPYFQQFAMPPQQQFNPYLAPQQQQQAYVYPYAMPPQPQASAQPPIMPPQQQHYMSQEMLENQRQEAAHGDDEARRYQEAMATAESINGAIFDDESLSLAFK
jgi:hypothetical protein